jgi:acyl-CoA synthetase (AMP-forming)/AMP-acid ligase II
MPDPDHSREQADVSTADIDQALDDTIARARSLNDIPIEEAGLPFRTLGHLLEEQADAYEQKVFLIFYSADGQRRELTYREFYEEVCRTANLFAGLGLQPGDRVATLDDNHPDLVITYFAAFLLGATVVPLDPNFDDAAIACILRSSRATLACVRDEYLERILDLRAQAPSCSTILQVGKRLRKDHPHLQTDGERLSTRFKPARTIRSTDEALVMYSCPPSGKPKGVILEHVNLLSEALAIGEWHRLSDDQRLMCILPVHHVKGIVLSLITPLAAGGGVVLTRAFQAEKFFERVAADRVTVVSTDPGLLEALLHAKLSVDAYKLAHLRHLICGAGPLTVELAQRFETIFKRPVIHAYGLSEATACSCCVPIDLTPPEHKRWLARHAHASVGIPLPVNEMTVLDEKGQETEEGQSGEIAIRGHNVMRSYDADIEATRAAFRNGWFMTGDAGSWKYDGEGRKFFFVEGRKSN